MDYETVRHSLKDGQIVFIDATTWKQKIISVITNGRFSHVGFLVWMTDAAGREKLMCLESSQGGARLVQLRSYLPRGITVVDIGLDWELCGEAALDETGVLHYSALNFILIGLKKLLMDINLPRLAALIPRDRSGEVCSEFVSTLLADKAGYVLDTFTSPNELFDILRLQSSYVRSIPIEPLVDTSGHK